MGIDGFGRTVAIGLDGFAVGLLKAGELVVPFEQGGDGGSLVAKVLIKLPNLGAHGVIVGVEEHAIV